MKTIAVSDEMFEFLTNLSTELNTQDNRATALPYFFQVQSDHKVPAAEGCGTKAYIYDDTIIETEEEIVEKIADYKNVSESGIKMLKQYEREHLLEQAGWKEIWYVVQQQYTNSFLTAKACDEHISRNAHHYNNGQSYLTHAFRNVELEKVLKFIRSISANNIEENATSTI